MIKKIIKKVFGILVFVLICASVLMGYEYVKYKNREVDELKREVQAQDAADLEQELLNKEIENAKNYVKNINNDIALTILRTSGKITLTHDKTPENNAWTEWLFNSDIKVYADYNTAFTIEMNNIQTSISDDATVNITYDEHDITLSSVDITDFTTSENKSIFGSSYTPEQVAAFEQIARNNILEKVDNDANRKQAQNNLESYFKVLAKNFDVKINIMQK
ncbi:MAG: DUF4230 domain-containing protein [Clostridia bacterium]